VAAPWPGNVRELENALERAAILADGSEIGPGHLVLEAGHIPAGAPTDGLRSLADLERDAIEQTLAAVGGNRKEAAERLGIGLRTLYDKLKRYRLG
jgi:two-component system response regulator AtoC